MSGKLEGTRVAVVGGGDAYVFVAAPDTSFKACGVGCAGPGGAPELHAGGDPTPGGTVTLTVTGAIPLTSALLFFGGMCAQPPVPIATMPGCALNIAPVNPFGLLLPIDQFGMGTMTSAPLPPLPSGLLGAVQAFVQDPAAPGGWVSTVGIEIHG